MSSATVDTRHAGTSLCTVNLLLDWSELEALLLAELERSDEPLDAFLLAAGMSQVLEDWLTREPFHLRRLAGRAPAPIAAVLRAADAVIVRSRRNGRLRREAARLAELVSELAACVVAGEPARGLSAPAHGTLPPALVSSVQKLPNCFQSFDQSPEDVGALVERFAARHPDRAEPLLVLGLRTSGSYLAPLCAAYLDAAGYEDVVARTYRPGTPLTPDVRRCLRGRRVLLLDDPPRTGKSLHDSARALERAGVRSSAITVLVALFSDGAIPKRLRRYECVVLPWEAWAVHERLPAPAAADRDHVRIAVDGGVVEGVGLGYFGRHALVVARALGAGDATVEDGLLHWRPPAPLGPLEEARVRAQTLALPDDRSLRLTGRNAAWEVAASAIELPFGKARPLVHRAVRKAARRLLTTTRPCVVDGGARSVVAGAFTSSGFHTPSFDPVFDLAGAGDPALRAAWERETGERISAERWLLYGLVHHWSAQERCLERRDAEGLIASERALARAQQAYAAEAYGLEPSDGDGPLCAIDVDGVLETRWLDFPALGPDGALALRALQRHGFRPVLVTGRSLAEVRERCNVYGLAGAVAEYGGAVYVRESDTVSDLLSDDDRRTLETTRAQWSSLPHVLVDAEFAHAVRAYRMWTSRSHVGIEPAPADDAIRVIPGGYQTDAQARGVDKGTGLEALAAALGAEVAFAAGDTQEDLPMIRLARRAFAPAQADPALRRVAAFTRRPYQAGLLEAVAAFLGHDPRRCPVCAPPPLSDDGRLLAAALRAKDAGRAAKLLAAARASWR